MDANSPVPRGLKPPLVLSPETAPQAMPCVAGFSVLVQFLSAAGAIFLLLPWVLPQLPAKSLPWASELGRWAVCSVTSGSSRL